MRDRGIRRTDPQNKTGGWWSSRRLLISDDLQVLEHAEHDRADKGESNIRGDDTKLADERTKGHRKPPEVRTLIALTRKASDPFHGKKVSVAVHPRHLGGAQWSTTWLKSRENKALMSP
jgi:hypothetical protein